MLMLQRRLTARKRLIMGQNHGRIAAIPELDAPSSAGPDTTIFRTRSSTTASSPTAPPAHDGTPRPSISDKIRGSPTDSAEVSPRVSSSLTRPTHTPTFSTSKPRALVRKLSRRPTVSRQDKEEGLPPSMSASERMNAFEALVIAAETKVNVLPDTSSRTIKASTFSAATARAKRLSIDVSPNSTPRELPSASFPAFPPHTDRMQSTKPNRIRPTPIQRASTSSLLSVKGSMRSSVRRAEREWRAKVAAISTASRLPPQAAVQIRGPLPPPRRTPARLPRATDESDSNSSPEQSVVTPPQSTRCADADEDEDVDERSTPLTAKSIFSAHSFATLGHHAGDPRPAYPTGSTATFQPSMREEGSARTAKASVSSFYFRAPSEASTRPSSYAGYPASILSLGAEDDAPLDLSELWQGSLEVARTNADVDDNGSAIFTGVGSPITPSRANTPKPIPTRHSSMSTQPHLQLDFVTPSRNSSQLLRSASTSSPRTPSFQTVHTQDTNSPMTSLILSAPVEYLLGHPHLATSPEKSTHPYAVINRAGPDHRASTVTRDLSVRTAGLGHTASRTPLSPTSPNAENDPFFRPTSVDGKMQKGRKSNGLGLKMRGVARREVLGSGAMGRGMDVDLTPGMSEGVRPPKSGLPVNVSRSQSSSSVSLIVRSEEGRADLKDLEKWLKECSLSI